MIKITAREAQEVKRKLRGTNDELKLNDDPNIYD